MRTLQDMQNNGRVQTEDPQQRTILDMLRNPRVASGMQAVATKYLTPEKMVSLCINTVSRTPNLLKCNPQSVLGAMMTSTALGLEPNTVLQQAFLIPYKTSKPKVDASGRNLTGPNGKWIWEEYYEAQFQIGYRGFITLFSRSPYIQTVTAEAIHEGDVFEHLMGSDAFLKYQKALTGRGPLVGSFCFTKVTGGGEQATILPLDEIEKIRNRSETYKKLVGYVQTADTEFASKKAQAKLDETPWVMWIDSMAAKSAVKQHAKKVAVGDSSLASASEIDSQGDMENIDLGAMVDPDVAKSVVSGGESIPEVGAEVSGEAYGSAAAEPAAEQAAAPAAEQAKANGEDDRWPKPFDNAGVIGWTDKDGSVYDPNYHGWSAQNEKPAIRTDGVFRTRRHLRGKGKTAPELTPKELEAKQATDEDAALKRAQAEAAGSVPPQGVDQRPTDGGFGELE